MSGSGQSKQPWYNLVYVPSDGDVSRLSSAELKALVIASNGGKRSTIAGRELGELKQMGEAAAVAALPVQTLKELVTRAGLSVRDVSEVEALRWRCREAMKRMRTLEMSFRPRPRGAPQDHHFPVTWRKFDIAFSGSQLGFALSLDNGGNLGVVRVTGPEATRAGLKANDILVAINSQPFADVWDTTSFEKDVLTRLLRAPRPLKLTFQIGDGRWPPTSDRPVISANTPPAPVKVSGDKTNKARVQSVDGRGVKRNTSPPPAAAKRTSVPLTKKNSPPPPPVYVDVKFTQRGTLGFSINLDAGRLVVVKVRETKMSPCWLAAVKPGDILVKLNGRAFGNVDPAIFDRVVNQLKITPRPMILSFRRRQQPVAAPQAKSTRPATSASPPVQQQQQQQKPKPSGQPSASTYPAGKSAASTTAAAAAAAQRAAAAYPAGRSAPRQTQPPQQTKPAPAKQATKPPPKAAPPAAAPKAATKPKAAAEAESSWNTFVQESAARETAAAAATGATSPSASSEAVPRDDGKVYQYDALFPSEYLGVALALSRSVETGSLHVEVTEVREKCACSEVEVHDQLVAINGTSVDDIKNESDFNTRVLQCIKAAGRPLTLTFISGNPDDSVCFSQSYNSDLFDDIADGDGIITQVKLIKALRKNEDLAKLLGLPQSIRQEDGSRDKFSEVFHTLAVKEDKSITKREWCVGISKLAGETLI